MRSARELLKRGIDKDIINSSIGLPKEVLEALAKKTISMAM